MVIFTLLKKLTLNTYHTIQTKNLQFNIFDVELQKLVTFDGLVVKCAHRKLTMVLIKHDLIY